MNLLSPSILFVGHEASRSVGPSALLHFFRWFKRNEQIAHSCQEVLNKASEAQPGRDYDWMVLELYNQTVRGHSKWLVWILHTAPENRSIKLDSLYTEAWRP